MFYIFWFRIYILSVLKKLRQKSCLTQNMPMLSISECTENGQIHMPLVETDDRAYPDGPADDDGSSSEEWSAGDGDGGRTGHAQGNAHGAAP